MPSTLFSQQMTQPKMNLPPIPMGLPPMMPPNQGGMPPIPNMGQNMMMPPLGMPMMGQPPIPNRK